MNSRSFFDSLLSNPSLPLIGIMEPTEHDEVSILSLICSAARLMEIIQSAIAQEKWDPSAVLSIGFKQVDATVLGHLLIIVTGTGVDIHDRHTIIEDSLISGFLRKDFFYSHILSTLAETVDLGAFDKGFERINDADRVFHTLYQTLFAQGGPYALRPLHGSSVKATSLILLGHTGKRVVVVAKHRIPESFTPLQTPTDGPARYATIDESAFAIAPFGQKRVFGIHVIQLALYLEEQIDRLDWQQTQINQGEIIELGVVDGCPGQLILTLKKGTSRYLLVNVRFTKSRLVLVIDADQEVNKVLNQDLPPIVRIHASGTSKKNRQMTVAHVDPHGRREVTYSSFDPLI